MQETLDTWNPNRTCSQVDSASRVGSESDHVTEGMTAIKELLVKKIQKEKKRVGGSTTF